MTESMNPQPRFDPISKVSSQASLCLLSGGDNIDTWRSRVGLELLHERSLVGLSNIQYAVVIVERLDFRVDHLHPHVLKRLSCKPCTPRL